MGSLVCCYMLLIYAITYYLSLGHTQQGGGRFSQQSNAFSLVDGRGANLKVAGLNGTLIQPALNYVALMGDEMHEGRF